MKVLVANLGSTSFKYRLFQMTEGSDTLLAQGGYENVLNHGDAIDECFGKLQQDSHIGHVDDIDAVGFKTVLGRNLSGCVEADDRVLRALDEFADVAPAHNPAYAAGIRQFSKKAPRATLVALFETAFFQWVPEFSRYYAVPESWRKAGLERHGFHGASHKFISERTAQWLNRNDVAIRVRNLYVDGPGMEPDPPLRMISCHLGGSSSLAGIRNGIAIGCSLGFSPQSGLPQNNRVGDLDAMAIPFIARTLGIPLNEIEKQLSKESGLLALSGVSNDLREILEAASKGDNRAQLAVDSYVDAIRSYLGAYYLKLNGCDAIVFTGGIGENSAEVRRKVCRNLGNLGIRLDEKKNQSLALGEEGDISEATSPVRILVIPANEELVVARETWRFIQKQQKKL